VPRCDQRCCLDISYMEYKFLQSQCTGAETFAAYFDTLIGST